MTPDPTDPAIIAHRLNSLEQASQQHARIITEALEKVGKGFTEEQMAQMRELFSEVLADAGLRVDEPDHQDAAREDFRFLRRLRLAWDGGVNRVGNAVMLAVLGILFAIIGAGFWAWLSQNIGGKP